ncbi:uncharacterized protein LOC102805966 [Saccoglossus kowalevskii]|uniref:Uncharacterized protein LOC102805966 n=1 Tax=Saccoglossus kowalevskii TaxID=10224 RepID=A0ABM0N169_SACKO|nr:PREDICTED: uncharacterized protein LOC102805966 [Saccoglossus kowalevskii]
MATIRSITLWLFLCGLLQVACAATISNNINSDTVFTKTESPYEVTGDITVDDEIILTIEPGVIVNFYPGSSLVVRGAIVARGTDAARITLTSSQGNFDTDLTEDFRLASIRLVDGGGLHQGRLEININGKWGTVSKDTWEQAETDVACRHLGFSGGTLSTSPPGTGNMWIDDIDCTGTEATLFECINLSIGQDDYDHTRDVGLECTGSQNRVLQHNYWRGIIFTGLSPLVTSLLQNVDISFTSGTQPSDIAGSVEVEGNPPTFENVNITNCLTSGILVSSSPNSVSIQDTVIYNCMNGITVSSVDGSIDITSVSALSNHGYGILISPSGIVSSNLVVSISEGLLENNGRSAITYDTTVSTEGSVRVDVKHSQINNNGMLAPPTPDECSAAITLNAGITEFNISANRFIGNQLGAVSIYTDNIETAQATPTTCIYNNYFEGNTGGEVIFLESEQESGLVNIHDNTIISNDLGEGNSVLRLHNVVSYVVNNLLVSNTGLYTLHWSHDTAPIGWQECYNNLLLYNSGNTPGRKLTLVTTGSGIGFYNNHFENPSNDYEFSGESGTTNALIDATENWWDSVYGEDIRKKIRDDNVIIGFPDVVFTPYRMTSPVISDACPIGYVLYGSNCYGLNGGSLYIDDARLKCMELGGTLPTSSDNTDVLAFLMFHGPKCATQVQVWIDDQPGCSVLTISFPTSSSIEAVDCSDKHPFAVVCKIPTADTCPSICSHNGICVDDICLCLGGWTGDDCSSFHCRDVNECSGHGTCVGPNTCKCINGWQGRDCSYSYCDSIDECEECSSSTGCGWCDTTLSCASGDGSGPDEGSCPSWFYYSCITIRDASDCSDKIKIINCEGNQCAVSTGNYFPGSCPTCYDVDHCYKDTPTGCRGWDEAVCPGGILHPDYSDTTRVQNSVLNSNVKLINEGDAILYSCPALNANDESDDSLLIVTQETLDIAEGDIIASIQSDGILHAVLGITQMETYTLILGKPAPLEDVIAYANFKQDVEVIQIEDSLVHENAISDSIALGLINGETVVDGSIHIINEATEVYKCLGNVYELEVDNSKRTVKTFFIVHPDTVIFQEGDIVVSNHSNGFLADVVDIDDSEMNATFVTTQLTHCSSATSFQPRVKTEIHDATGSEVIVDLVCSGGNKIPGLLILENIPSSDLDIVVGDTVIGMSSSAFLGKVVNSRIYDGRVFIELLEISTNDDLLYVDVGGLVPVRRRKRKELSWNPEFSLSNTFPFEDGPVTFNVTPKVDFSPTFSLNFDVNWWGGITRVGVGFDGKLTASLETVLNWNMAGDASWSHNLLDITVGRFVIPYIFVPGVFQFVVDIKGSVGYKIEGTVTGEVGASSNLTTGATWTKAEGVRLNRPKVSFEPFVSASASFNTAGLASAVAEAAIVPQFNAQLPPQGVNLQKLTKKLPKWMKQLLPNDDSGIATTNDVEITLGIATTIKGKVSASLCSGKCADPDKQVRVDVEGGIPAITGDANFKLFKLVDESVNLFTFQTPDWYNTTGWCLGTFLGLPCCVCSDGMPGILDLTNGACTRCKCWCDNRKTIGGYLNDEDTCVCASCPDGTPMLPVYPECPCLCPDGNIMAMNVDGTCPCISRTKRELDGAVSPVDCTCDKELMPGTTEDGCVCVDDCACTEDEEPVLVDGECVCRPLYICGISYVCVVGRKGEFCTEPECAPCAASPECSGHGTCVALDNCNATCRCDEGWMGLCCDSKYTNSGQQPNLPDGVGQGDPHLRTFDGLKYDFQGYCTYTIVRNSPKYDGVSFEITADFRSQNPRTPYKPPTRMITINIAVEGKEFIQLMEDNTILVNGNNMSNTHPLTLSNNSVLVQTENGASVVNINEPDITITWKGNIHKVDVILRDDNLRGSVHGLFGDADGSQDNDFQKPNGDIATTAEEFGNSWLVPGSCPANL